MNIMKNKKIFAIYYYIKAGPWIYGPDRNKFFNMEDISNSSNLSLEEFEKLTNENFLKHRRKITSLSELKASRKFMKSHFENIKTVRVKVFKK